MEQKWKKGQEVETNRYAGFSCMTHVVCSLHNTAWRWRSCKGLPRADWPAEWVKESRRWEADGYQNWAEELRRLYYLEVWDVVILGIPTERSDLLQLAATVSVPKNTANRLGSPYLEACGVAEPCFGIFSMAFVFFAFHGPYYAGVWPSFVFLDRYSSWICCWKCNLPAKLGRYAEYDRLKLPYDGDFYFLMHESSHPPWSSKSWLLLLRSLC